MWLKKETFLNIDLLERFPFYSQKLVSLSSLPRILKKLLRKLTFFVVHPSRNVGTYLHVYVFTVQPINN